MQNTIHITYTAGNEIDTIYYIRLGTFLDFVEEKLMYHFDVNGTTVPAIVSRIIHLGWEIQVELTLDDGQAMTAHLTRERFDELKLEPQEKVYVKPKDAKSFPLYYSI
jgi:ABC-type sulfate/molybdate transport systems ATPase subunit